MFKSSQHPSPLLSSSILEAACFSSQRFKATLHQSWATRAEKPKSRFRVKTAYGSTLSCLPNRAEGPPGRETLTPVPLAGTMFWGGEHTVQGSACMPVTASWVSHVSTHQPFPKDDSSWSTRRALKTHCLPKGQGIQTFTCTPKQATPREHTVWSRNGSHFPLL